MPDIRPSDNSTSGLPDYPVKHAFGGISKILGTDRILALEAPTGSGKTTLLPVLIHGAGLSKKKILLTQPRRIAAKSVAARINQLLGGQPHAGYRVRGESDIKKSTIIEVVTEGYALAMLQADPFLTAYDWVIIDEFHERHTDGDLLLAMMRDLRRSVDNEDAPGLILMTATWQGQPREKLRDFSFYSIEGRLFPVEKRFFIDSRNCSEAGQLIERRLGPAVKEALKSTSGKILVFMPGRRELEASAGRLRTEHPGTEIDLLYGGLELKEQQRILQYGGGKRQIILSTAIAETSLTIEGVTAVVDSGLERLPVFQPAQAVTRLVTRRLSRATSEQRAGRAGRLGPGLYLRLWTETEDLELVDRWEPEITAGDLSGARLQTALWGSEDIPWLTPPPDGPWLQAEKLLQEIGALDAAGQVTGHGRLLAGLPLPPRLAHMTAASPDIKTAAFISVLLSEGYRAAGRTAAGKSSFSDILASAGTERSASNLRKTAADIVSRFKGQARRDSSASDDISVGAILSLAYPDRIGKSSNHGNYILSSGTLVECRSCGSEWAVFPDISGPADRLKARIHEAVDFSEIGLLHPDMFTVGRYVEYHEETYSFRAFETESFGSIVLKKIPGGAASTEEMLRALTAITAKRGLSALPLNSASRRLLAKLKTAAETGLTDLPASDEKTLESEISDWLGPWLNQPLTAESVFRALESRLSWDQQSRLNRLFPKEIELRPGIRKPVDYSNPDKPLIRGRMQEFYGCCAPLTIAGGRITLAVELLSPAMRPLQLTSDLGGFWKGSYTAIRAEMRGRYPKHYWPENPATAEPSLATGKRRPEED